MGEAESDQGGLRVAGYEPQQPLWHTPARFNRQGPPYPKGPLEDREEGDQLKVMDYLSHPSPPPIVSIVHTGQLEGEKAKDFGVCVCGCFKLT